MRRGAALRDTLLQLALLIESQSEGLYARSCCLTSMSARSIPVPPRPAPPRPAPADEAHAAIAAYLPRIAPDSCGGPYLRGPGEDDSMSLVWHWGDGAAQHLPDTFSNDGCWALRRTQVHRVDQPAGAR